MSRLEPVQRRNRATTGILPAQHQNPGNLVAGEIERAPILRPEPQRRDDITDSQRGPDPRSKKTSGMAENLTQCLFLAVEILVASRNNRTKRADN